MPLSRRDFIKGGIITAGIASAAQLAPHATPAADNPVFPKHDPIGKGQGINPGRVVWMHDPDSVRWSGVDFWWKPANFNQKRIQKMIQSGLIRLTGANTPQKAWQALFEWRNAQNGKQGGYRPGQKIAVKVNMNGAGEYNDDPTGQLAAPYGNAALLQTLLLSLAKEGEVNPEDITVFDACRIFPDYMRQMCAQGQLAGVKFSYRDIGGKNDAKADKNAQIIWAGNVKGAPTYFPKCVTEADYLINCANLKGHSWGMTLGAKNHFGSFINSERRTTPAAAGLHDNIINVRPGEYSVLADLIARRELNTKTILWMLDALITAPSETGNITPENSIWQMSPFNGEQACSLFFSQDPIAIDSVGADFLVNEPNIQSRNGNMRHNHGMENYLHEAALLDNPPSGAKYSDGHGKNPGSLGAHEHWNNAEEKLYSRNLGKNAGIELVKN